MTIQLNFGRDVQGMNAYAPQMSDIMYSCGLASADDDYITVPESNDNWIAVFSYQPGGTIWVSVNDTAAPPASGSFSSTTSFLLPSQLKVKKSDEISFYNNSSTDQDIGVALYAVP